MRFIRDKLCLAFAPPTHTHTFILLHVISPHSFMSERLHLRSSDGEYEAMNTAVFQSHVVPVSSVFMCLVNTAEEEHKTHKEKKPLGFDPSVWLRVLWFLIEVSSNSKQIFSSWVPLHRVLKAVMLVATWGKFAAPGLNLVSWLVSCG